MARLFVPNVEWDKGEEEMFRSFDVIISYLHDPSGVVCENLERVGAMQVLCGSPLPEGRHAAKQLMEPMNSLALFNDDPIPHLELQTKYKEAGRHWLNKRCHSALRKKNPF